MLVGNARKNHPQSKVNIMNDKPPIELWVVAKRQDIEPDDPYTHVHSYAFATKEAAEREKEAELRAAEHYREEEGEWPYANHEVTVHKIKLTDRRLSEASRQDEESYRIAKEAAGAVGASLLADEGIGPLADDSDK